MKQLLHSILCFFLLGSIHNVFADNCNIALSFSYSESNGQVLFNNYTSNADAYLWDFGDGTTSIMKSPAHAFAESGAYLVCFTAYNAIFNCERSLCINVFVAGGAAPVDCSDLSADFFPMLNDGYHVAFLNQTVGEADKYVWNLGDGSSQETENIQHTYTEPGVYEVCMEAHNSNTNCSTQHCEWINIVPYTYVPVIAPIIQESGISAGFTYEVNGLEVSFINVSQAADEYLWQVTPDEMLAESNPTFSYSEAGTYDVCLYASNNLQMEFDVFCTEIVVECVAPVEASFTFEQTGTSFNFTNTSTNATTYDWSFGDNSLSIAANPSHTFTDTGFYEVCLNVYNASTGCQNSSCQDVLIVAELTADFTYTLDGFTANFTNNSEGADEYFWFVEPTIEGFDTNFTYEFPGTGSYQVCLYAFSEVSLQFAEYCETILIVQGIIPVGTCTNSADFEADVINMTATFNDTSVGSYTQVFWDFGDGNSSIEPNPSHTYNVVGAYTVSLTITDDDGSCQEISTQTINITEPIVCDIVAGFNYNIATASLAVDFTSTASGDFAQMRWDFGDGTNSSSLNPSHTYTDAGVYEVIMVASNPNTACADTSTQIITVSSPNDAYIRKIMVDECGTPAGQQEALFLQLGETPVTISEMRVNWASDNDWLGFCSNAVTTDLMNSSILGGGEFLEPTGGILPANAMVMILTSEAFDPSVYDLSAISTNIYVLYHCGTTSSGFFPNNTETLVYTTVQFAPGVLQTVAYNNAIIGENNGNGAYLTFNAAGEAQSANDGCVLVDTELVTPVCELSSQFNYIISTYSQVSFINTTIGTADEYSWNFGDGNTSSLANPSHTYPISGTYEVCLRASNGEGCNNIYCEAITITVPCEVASSFTYSLSNQDVSFISMATGNVTNVEWNFGDGNTSTDLAPVHTYADTGSYIACLTAYSGEDCSDPYCATIEVDAPEVCAITPAFGQTVNGLAVDFVDTSMGDYDEVSWNFGDGSSSGEANPTHTYAEEGTYFVCISIRNTLTACNEMACANVTVTVTVPNGNNGNGNNGNGGGIINPFGKTNETKSVSSPSNNTAEENSGSSIELNTPSIYDTGEQADNCSFEIAFEYECDGLNVHFMNASKGDFNEIEWQTGDGVSLYKDSPKYTYKEAGPYTFTLYLTNTKTNCQKSYSGMVYVFD